MTIWDLLVTLGLDSSKFHDGTAKAKEEAVSASKAIVSSLSTVGGAVVMGAFAAAGSAIAGIGGLLASSIGPASDLNETVSKVGVVFGDQAENVRSFGETAATALGMSSNAALSAAGTYGNLFRAMGMTTNESAAMSVNLVELAADLASFNNIRPEDALEKLRAGLAGETEPLRSLGVNINAASVEARALKMNLVMAGQELTAAAKASATYSLIMEQTSLAQGDFARTSTGLANQQRILSASFENVKAQVGSALLPAITQVYQMMNQWLSDPSMVAGLTAIARSVGEFAVKVVQDIPKAIQWFTNLVNYLNYNRGIVAGIMAAMGVAVAAFVYSTVIPAMIAMVTAFGPALAIMAATGVGVYLLYNNFSDGFAVMKEVAIAFSVIMRSVGGVLSGIFEGLSMGWSAFTDGVEGSARFVITAIQSLIAWFEALIYTLGSMIIPTWLVPGSPPPLAYAIQDINDQLRVAASSALPSFNAQLNATISGSSGSSAGMPAYAGMTSSAGMDTKELARAIRDAIRQVI